MATVRVETFEDGQLIEARDVPISDEKVNADAIHDKAEAAIARMTQIADAGAFTAAQRDNAIRDNARAIRLLLRLQLGRYDAAE